MRRRIFLLWSTLVALLGFELEKKALDIKVVDTPGPSRKMKTVFTGVDPACGPDETWITISGIDIHGNQVMEHLRLEPSGEEVVGKYAYKTYTIGLPYSAADDCTFEVGTVKKT